jgi:hypothetical protein
MLSIYSRRTRKPTLALIAQRKTMNEPELYGIPAETIALLCKVCITTARRWKRGRRRMPETARMILAGDLGCFDPAWHGWRDGKQVSPEGWELSPGDVLSISLLRAQIAAYQAKERQFQAIEEQPLPADVPAMFG